MGVEQEVDSFSCNKKFLDRLCSYGFGYKAIAREGFLPSTSIILCAHMISMYKITWSYNALLTTVVYLLSCSAESLKTFQDV